MSFNAEAAFRFRTGNRATKRLILQLVGSNPTLKDRKFLVEGAKPFRRWPAKADDSLVWSYVEDVRTFATDPASEATLKNLKKLMTPDASHEDDLAA